MALVKLVAERIRCDKRLASDAPVVFHKNFKNYCSQRHCLSMDRVKAVDEEAVAPHTHRYTADQPSALIYFCYYNWPDTR